MAYAAASDVAALCRNLLGGASAFSATTCPNASQVTAWLSSGCALINSVVKSKGYTAIGADSDVYEFATAANAHYAAWQAERSRISARVTNDERTKADQHKRDFEWHLKLLRELDLSQLGVSQTGRVKTSGIGVTDKQTNETDTDRVQPRFSRGLFRNREAVEPVSTAAGDPQARDTN